MFFCLFLVGWVVCVDEILRCGFWEFGDGGDWRERLWGGVIRVFGCRE